MKRQPWKDYLGGTIFCDPSHARIRECAEKLRGGRCEREAAQAIFSFVRDRIVYRFDYPWRKASETLESGAGNCFTKATLHISLLRAAGIEAGYGVCLIRKEVFRPILPENIFEMVNDPTPHAYCTVNLSGRWVACDATIDRGLFEAVYASREHWMYRHWDGIEDIRLDPAFIVEEQGIYANIDLYLGSPVRFWTDDLLREANEYLDRIRQSSGKEA